MTWTLEADSTVNVCHKTLHLGMLKRGGSWSPENKKGSCMEQCIRTQDSNRNDQTNDMWKLVVNLLSE